MAGAGKKTFVAGEVLTAAQVNDYLMDQAVMRFSGSAARAASITVPTEGMVSYLDDRNQIEIYNGTSWVPSGVGVYSASTARNEQIPTPTAGLISYLSSTDRFEYYNGSAWVALDSITRLGPGTTGQVLVWQTASFGWQSIASGAKTLTASAAQVYYKIVTETDAGTIVVTGNSAATASLYFYSSASAFVASVATVNGVGSTTLGSNSAYFFAISSASANNISVETVTSLSGTTGSLQTASATGTWSGTPGQYWYAVIGGGAGGAPTQPTGGGGGGGSGYVTRGASVMTAPVSVTIGAGGGAAAAGGTTTFGGISASGGVAVPGQVGGAGGSGGGGGAGPIQPGSYFNGGPGGTDGAGGTAGGSSSGPGTGPGGGSGSGTPVQGFGISVPTVYYGGTGGLAWGGDNSAPNAGSPAPASAYAAGGGGGNRRFPATVSAGGSGAPGVVYLLGGF